MVKLNIETKALKIEMMINIHYISNIAITVVVVCIVII